MKTGKELIQEIFKFPLKYDEQGSFILDANNNIALDIRGWGKIQYKPNPLETQDAIGEYIADILNKSVE